VAVADDAILMDLDTEADYQFLLRRLATLDRPSADACRVLMTMVKQVPPAVWRHCRAVATVAGIIADALQVAGLDIDADLLQSAALVHDIARDLPDHAATGTKLLADLGYPLVAALVAVHMDLPAESASVLDEAAILFLADKLVVGDRPGNLETRFNRKMAKYGADARTVAAIARRRRAAETVQAAVEQRTGRTITDILTAGAVDDAQIQ
jgi:HD superfamily phosphohydrolase YqeK